MGDYTECITPDDAKRWDVSGIAEWVEKANIIESQKKWIVNLFKPIASQCVGLLEGNHECDIRKKHHNDIYMNVCEALGVTPLGYSCFLDLIFKRQGGTVTQFRGRLTHGSGCPQTDGARLNRLKKGLKDYDADFYAHAHIHAITIDPGTPILAVDGAGKIYHRNRVAAMTGCWFKTFEQGVRPSYGEIKDYSPSVIGCPVFSFAPDKHLLTVAGTLDL